MLDEYYLMTRRPLDGEIEFWVSGIDETKRVLEIGAGQGFLSRHLLNAGPRSLTMAEPLLNCQKYLEPLKTDAGPVETQTYYQKFEDLGFESEFDLVIFAYDSLPMIPKENLTDFFRQVHLALKPGGRFVFHISTPEWNQKYISQFQRVYHANKELPSGRKVKIFSWAEEISEDYYLKHFVFVDEENLQPEYYCMPAQILYHGYIERLCQDAGLKLVQCQKSFDGQDGPDDLIYTICKLRG